MLIYKEVKLIRYRINEVNGMLLMIFELKIPNYWEKIEALIWEDTRGIISKTKIVNSICS